jgi:hypothetical protein
MRKGRSTAARTPRKPATAEAGALVVRKFAIKLFDRDEGETANWPLIAETLFKAAFDALDKSPDDTHRTMLLRHIHAGSYERLAPDSATNEARAMTSQNEAASIELTSPGSGKAADAFRNIN